MPKYVAAIDQGTTSTRCMLFDHGGQVISIAQKEHEQIFPRPGWVEHNPIEIWERTRTVIQDALILAGADAAHGDIAAAGITNQRETTLVWDRKTGRAYYNAIVWQDTRTDQIINVLASEGGQDRFRAKVGLPLATYFSGPKIKWILDNVDGVRAAAERGDAVFGNVDSWIIWWLTGGPDGGAHVTDVTNASRTMLMDLHTLDWDDEILGILGIPRQMLPQIRPSSDPQGWGCTREDGPFGASVPVCGDLGDQQAALVGQTCFSPGEGKNTYGTGCFMLLNTGPQPVVSKCGLLTTLGYKLGNEPAVYALEGSIAVTGALVQWLRDNLELIGRSSEIETLAATVEDNGGVYFVPAFSGLFAPYWQSDARGVIVGLTRFVNRGACRACGAGGDSLPDTRSGRRDGKRLRRAVESPEGGRWDGVEQPANAVPGRHPGSACRAPAGRRDDRAGRGLRSRAGAGFLEQPGGPARQLADRPNLAAAHARGHTRAPVPQLAEGRWALDALAGIEGSSTPEMFRH